MANALSWLTTYFGKTGHAPRTNGEKFKYEPLEATCASSEDGLQVLRNSAEYAAADQRIEYLKEVYIERSGALSGKQFIERADKAQFVALQKQIDEHWVTLKKLCQHSSALAGAYYDGRDIDFDMRFWLENIDLWTQLPDSMKPASVAFHLQGPQRSTAQAKEGMTSIRRREHFQPPAISV